MHSKDEMRAFLLDYAARWPQLELTDLIKLLYQSAFGCGHFAPDEHHVLAYLEQEIGETKDTKDAPLVELVLGGYARVHLAPYAARGMKSQTLARLFMLTANEPAGDERRAWFSGALDLLIEMAGAGELPFTADAAQEQIALYRASGCPSVHHSERFRAANHPAYRIVRGEYAQLLPLFARIDALLAEKERVIVAIDGNSGAGKSTLAALLEKVYDGATLAHMDDFFLQMHQRTKERFETPGGNVDHERFLSEVLMPMRRGDPICYRPLDCARMAIGEGKEILPGRLCIVEGSYSLHPELEAAYDLKVLLSISPAAQAERILRRNGPQMFGRFMNEWIPMENLYFDATRIDERCDLRIGVVPEKDGVRYAVRETEETA